MGSEKFHPMISDLKAPPGLNPFCSLTLQLLSATPPKSDCKLIERQYYVIREGEVGQRRRSRELTS